MLFTCKRLLITILSFQQPVCYLKFSVWFVGNKTEIMQRVLTNSKFPCCLNI